MSSKPNLRKELSALRRCGANPLCMHRVPDARWRHAQFVVQTGRNARLKRDGPQVVRAIRFLRAQRSNTAATEPRKYSEETSDVADAIELEYGSILRRLELQCRVLANESSLEIAHSLETKRSVVEMYCDLFFDIREHLDFASDHLIQHVIGMPLQGNFTLAALARLSAYHHGRHVIPAWIDYLAHEDETHDLTTDTGRQRESIALHVLAEKIGRSPCPNDQMLRATSEIHHHFPRKHFPRPPSQTIQRQINQLLQEQFQPGDDESDLVPLLKPASIISSDFIKIA